MWCSVILTVSRQAFVARNLFERNAGMRQSIVQDFRDHAAQRGGVLSGTWA
jgi:hypothetical protein